MNKMTLPNERFNSIRICRSWLEDILKGEQKFPKGKRESAEKAYRLLKHFPDQHWIDRVEKMYYECLQEKNR